MNEITTIGIDLAKHVFPVHGVDVSGAVVVRKAIRRAQVLRFFKGLPRCLVGMEACATAHYWAREIAALGHEVRLMAPQYGKAYVKRNKNDAADAEAICDAVRWPSMRFVPVKSAEQQAVLTMHRARELLNRQRTMLINALRAHLAEFGIVGAQGIHRVCDLVAIVADEGDGRVPAIARGVLRIVADQIARSADRDRQDRRTHPRLAPNERHQPAAGRNARRRTDHRLGHRRERARCIGVPLWQGVCRLDGPGTETVRHRRQDVAGSDQQTRRRIWRRLLITGALTALTRSRAVKAMPWMIGMKERAKRPMVIAVALANKLARTAWAMMVRATAYHASAA